MQRGVSIRNRRVIILGIAGVALAIVTFIGPWWWAAGQGVEMGNPISWESGFGIFGDTFGSTVRGYAALPNTAAVFTTTEALLIIGLVAGGAMVAASALREPSLWIRVLGGASGVVAFGVTLAAPLYVMAQVEGAFTVDWLGGGGVAQPRGGTFILPVYSSFWGSWSRTTSSSTMSWSCWAGWAWYAAILVPFLFLIATALLFWGLTTRQRREDSPPEAHG